MLVVTTPGVIGRRVVRYLGVVSGEAILGDYETIQMNSGGGMLMVSAGGTAVVLE
jgi:uncharacterized protein YbjQ (UPF0145 family)